MGVGFLVSLVFTPISLRLLGQSEYGLYNLVASVVSYLGILNFGFGSAYVRYFSRYEVEEEEDKVASLNGMFLLVFSVLGLVAVIAGFILARYTGVIFGSNLTAGELAKARILMYILVLNLGFSFPSIVFTSYITANERFIFQRVIQLVKVVISPFFVLIALYAGFASVGMALATSLVNLAVELVYVLYAFRKLKMKFSFRGIERGLVLEISIFSAYIFINMVIDQINWNVDKFIIGRYRGTASVAIYGVASTLHTYYQQISTAISNVFIPRVHRIVAESDDNRVLTELFTRIGRVQFMITSLVSSGLIFFGKPFIMKWAGRGYAESFDVALLLILPVTVPLIQTIGIEIQRAKNLHKFRSIAYLFIAVANLVLSIPLTERYGATGAALGTAISMIIGNGLVMNLYNHFRVGLDMVYFWKEILSFLPGLVLPAAAGILMVRYADLHKLTILLACGLLYVAVFCLSVWFFGMNDYERKLVASPVRRIFKKKS